MFRCSKNGQTFRSRNSDGLLSHIKGSIACRISVGGGGGGNARSPKGRAAARGLDAASASNTLSCLLEMLHLKELRSIKMLIDSNHGIYRDHLIRRETQMRVIGLDVHRSFAEVAILENGTIKHAGRLKLEHQRVVAFGKALKRSDEVVLEATGNTGVIVRLLMPFVRRVVVANPLQVRAIAWAKVKTDKRRCHTCPAPCQRLSPRGVGPE